MKAEEDVISHTSTPVSSAREHNSVFPVCPATKDGDVNNALVLISVLQTEDSRTFLNEEISISYS